MAEEAGHVEGDDVEPGAVGAKAEPDDEGDEANDEEEAEEDGAYELAESVGEAFLHAARVVASAVGLGLVGWWLPALVRVLGVGRHFEKLFRGWRDLFVNERREGE